MTAIAMEPLPGGTKSGLAPEVARVLRRAPIFAGIGEDAVQVLMRQVELVRTSNRDVLFQQGDPGDFLYIVVSGTVRLSRRDGNNEDRMVAILGQSDHFGELSLLDSGPRTATATVVSRGQLARISRTCLDEWMLERPEIAVQMLRVISRRLRRTRADVADMVFVDVAARVARQLLKLAPRFGSVRNGELWVDHNLTQAELADLVGSSRETVNRTLSEFANRGWVRLERGSIAILDRDRLLRRAR